MTENPKNYARDEKKLAKAQRKHAKKKKRSKNRDKARRKGARLHARIADIRRDFQHQASTKLIRENPRDLFGDVQCERHVAKS
ncbi:transposase [Ktedonobacter racemifer]|uniref:transposase n=1 Tax=Ktedonobacter racemifer TaxID=363277 RepID=UPI000A02913A|nr:transposase [Ktedonobacter racemifer]